MKIESQLKSGCLWIELRVTDGSFEINIDIDTKKEADDLKQELLSVINDIDYFIENKR